MTAKTLLTENRESVISSIKYVCQIWKKEDLAEKMSLILAYFEEFPETQLANIASAKNTKTQLKMYIQKYFACERIKKERAENLKRYGTEKPKLADIMSFGAQLHEDRGEKWHPVLKEWVKA